MDSKRKGSPKRDNERKKRKKSKKKTRKDKDSNLQIIDLSDEE
jgi:hypothetical protein